MVTGLPKQAINLRDSKEEAVISFLTASEVNHHHFYNILLVTLVNPIHCGKELQRAWVPGDEDQWKPFLNWISQCVH